MSWNNHLEVETGDVHRMAGNIYRFFTPPSTLVPDLLECLWTERDHMICDRYQTIQQERSQRSWFIDVWAGAAVRAFDELEGTEPILDARVIPELRRRLSKFRWLSRTHFLRSRVKCGDKLPSHASTPPFCMISSYFQVSCSTIDTVIVCLFFQKQRKREKKVAWRHQSVSGIWTVVVLFAACESVTVTGCFCIVRFSSLFKIWVRGFCVPWGQSEWKDWVALIAQRLLARGRGTGFQDWSSIFGVWSQIPKGSR